MADFENVLQISSLIREELRQIDGKEWPDFF